MKIAVIGASNNREKFGNKCVRAYLMKGHEVFPVNPEEDKIEGLKAYKSLSEIPAKIDVVSLYVRPDIGIKIADEIIKKKVPKVFLNPGTESPEIIEKLEKKHVIVLPRCSIVAIGVNPSEL